MQENELELETFLKALRGTVGFVAEREILSPNVIARVLAGEAMGVALVAASGDKAEAYKILLEAAQAAGGET